MNRLACYAKWAATIAATLLALLLGAVIVCFGVPFAYGIASDIAAMASAGPVAVALEAAAAILLWRLSRRRVPYAAKSMT